MMSKENPHSPPGPYVMFDNLDKEHRLVMNIWTIYDPHSKQEGLYMRYLFIHCNGVSKCIDLWDIDIIKITKNLDLEIEWDRCIKDYCFVQALQNRSIEWNKIKYTYEQFVPVLEKNKEIRDLVFASGVKKKLTNFNSKEDLPYEYYHELVVDEGRPFEDIEWDISSSVKIRYRINFIIHITSDKKLELIFDRGDRGLPAIRPVGWYPTREMDGLLISKEKALAIPNFSYVKELK